MRFLLILLPCLAINLIAAVAIVWIFQIIFLPPSFVILAVYLVSSLEAAALAYAEVSA